MLTLPSLQGLPSCWQALRQYLETEALPETGQIRRFIENAADHRQFEQDFNHVLGIDVAEFIRIKRTAAVLQTVYPSSPNRLTVTTVATPLGGMLAVFAESGLSLLEFVGQNGLETELRALQKHCRGQFVFQENLQTALLKQELAAYFQGRLKTFSVPLQMVGTPFQQQVWHALLAIPYGETRSYKEQAEWLQNAKAVRAVAAANGKNKISIIVPCHRVIGSDGSLVGYAGGMVRKQALLALEQQNHQLQTALF